MHSRDDSKMDLLSSLITACALLSSILHVPKIFKDFEGGEKNRGAIFVSDNLNL